VKTLKVKIIDEPVSQKLLAEKEKP